MALGGGISNQPNKLPVYNALNAFSVTNLTSSNLKHWRAAIARVRAGTGRGTLICNGDSTTAGLGAGVSGSYNLVGAYPKSYCADLAILLNKFVPTSDNSIFGDQCISAAISYNSFDSRLTLNASGSGWAFNQGAFSCNLLHYTTGSAGTTSFTPAGAFDTIKVVYPHTGGSGTVSVNVDGGSTLGTITASGSGEATLTLTVTKGTHTINLVGNNLGDVYINGIITYDSTTPAIDIIHAGSSGATIATLTATGSSWFPLNMLTYLAPDAVILNCTINDSNANTPLASYTTAVQSFITTVIAANGDVILSSGVPSNTTNATNGVLDQYIGAMSLLAATNGNVMVSLKARLTSYAVTNPILPYYDSLHPGPLLYQDVAQAYFQVLSQP